MYFYLLDKDEKLFKAVGRRAIQKIEESISITDTNLVSKSAAIEYSSRAVQEELRKAVYVAIPRYRESDLLSTYEGPSRYDLFYIIDGAHNGSTVILTLREAAMEELNTTITGSRMSAQDSEGRDIEVRARSVIDGILENSTFEYEWRSSSTDTSIFTYDTEPISDVLADFVRVYGIEMEYVVEFDGTEVSKKILKFHDEIGNGADRPVDRISYAHDAINIKKSEGRESIRTALIGIGSKKDITKLPHQIIADGKVVSRSRLGLSGTHMGRSDWLTYNEAGSLAEDSNALAESLDAKRVREEVVQAGMTLYESNINFKDYEFKKSDGYPVDKPRGQEYIEIPELTQVNGIKTPGGMKPKVGVSQHTDITNIKALAWKAYLEILESNREQITYTASATILNANIGDYATVVYPEVGLNDTRRVINITRNRLDDSVSGVTLGDHRARSALRRAQEVQKEEEETFVDTFMNQRPGGSNRTRSFNPLGTNFSPRDFGRFGRGNYGTIENPIGRDLFDGGIFESLGLEPGQTVPEAIGGGGGDGVLAEYERDYSNFRNLRRFIPRFRATMHDSPDEYGAYLKSYSEKSESLEDMYFRLYPDNRIITLPDGTTKRSTRVGGWYDNEISVFPLPSAPFTNNKMIKQRHYDRASTYPYELLEDGREVDVSIPLRYGLSQDDDKNASVGVYTNYIERTNETENKHTRTDRKVGLFFNALSGKVEIAQENILSQIPSSLAGSTAHFEYEDGPLPLELFIDARAVGAIQFYMQNYIFPSILNQIHAERTAILGYVENIAFAFTNFLADNDIYTGYGATPEFEMIGGHWGSGIAGLQKEIDAIRNRPENIKGLSDHLSAIEARKTHNSRWYDENSVHPTGGVIDLSNLAAETFPIRTYFE